MSFGAKSVELWRVSLTVGRGRIGGRQALQNGGEAGPSRIVMIAGGGKPNAGFQGAVAADELKEKIQSAEPLPPPKPVHP